MILISVKNLSRNLFVDTRKILVNYIILLMNKMANMFHLKFGKKIHVSNENWQILFILKRLIIIINAKLVLLFLNKNRKNSCFFFKQQKI